MTFKQLLLTAAVMLGFTLTTMAQSIYNVDTCKITQISLNTGAYENGSIIPFGQQDPNWKITSIQNTTPMAGYTIPYQPFVISRFNTWFAPTNSRWLNRINSNNDAGGPLDTHIEYTRHFTTLQNDTFKIKLNFSADNFIDYFRVDGVNYFSAPITPTSPCWYCQLWPALNDTIIYLPAGCHDITVSYGNYYGGSFFSYNPAGLLLEGYIKSLHNDSTILRQKCVTNTPPTLTAKDTINYCANCELVSPNLTITSGLGCGNLDTVKVYFTTGYTQGQDTLQFIPQLGINSSFNASTGVLKLYGNANYGVWETVLRTVCYRSLVANNSNNNAIKNVVISLGNALYNPANGHYYKLVNNGSAISWHAAKNAAAATSYYGLQGYLVTVTDSIENNFIASLLQQNSWFGASDSLVEGEWRWVTGCEGLEQNGIGRLFSNQFINCPFQGLATGIGLNGNYVNWFTNEPNNSGCNENYGHYLGNNIIYSNQWNDFPDNGYNLVNSYIIEYGCMPNDPIVNLADNITINLLAKKDTIINQTICQGSSFLGYNITGIYIDTFATASGCDSIRTLNLTVKPTQAFTINQTICQPNSYLGYSASGTFIDTFQNQYGCDSIRTLNLIVKPMSYSFLSQTICQGQSYLGHTASGVYNDTLLNAQGCDSVRSLTLTVNPPLTLSANDTINYCANCEPVSPNLTITSSLGCGNLDTVKVYFTTGYTQGQDTLQFMPQLGINSSFNTSTGVLKLYGNSNYGVWETVLRTVCYRSLVANNSNNNAVKNVVISLGNALYNPANEHYYKLVNNGSAISWHAAKNAAAATSYYGLQGYLVTITSAQENNFITSLIQSSTWIGASDNAVEGTWRWVTGCEGLEDGGQGRYFSNYSAPVNGNFTNWALTPPCYEPNNCCGGEDYLHLISSNTTLCGNLGEWNDFPDNGYNLVNSYIIEYGCMPNDPIINLAGNITINLLAKKDTIINQTICQGSSFLGYNTTGTFIDTFTTASGCDSIRTLNLTVKPTQAFTINQTICQPNSYLGYSASGTFIDTFQNQFGCDSIRTLNLIVKPMSYSTLSQTICQPNSYLGYNITGTFLDTFINANGCDSVRTINLIVNVPTASIIIDTICAGQNTFGYTATGIYVDYFINSKGCDSTRTLELFVKQKSSFTYNYEMCSGETYLGHSTTGTYIDTFINSLGCDSVLTLNIIVHPVYVVDTVITLCIGDSLFVGKAWQTVNGVYKDTFSSIYGCDSIKRTTLKFTNNLNPNIIGDSAFCQGDSVLLFVKKFKHYLWNTGDTTDRITVYNTGQYIIRVTNDNYCFANDTINVDMKLLPNVSLSFTNRELCKYDTIQLSANGALNYYWYTPDMNRLIGSQNPINYSIERTPITVYLKGVDENNCVNYDSVTLYYVNCCGSIFVPNAFSPNGDGKNDVFKPTFNQVKFDKYIFQVFNRYGQKVFETNNMRTYWDGKQNGNTCDIGTYYYLIKTNCFDSQEDKIISGDINLLR